MRQDYAHCSPSGNYNVDFVCVYVEVIFMFWHWQNLVPFDKRNIFAGNALFCGRSVGKYSVGSIRPIADSYYCGVYIGAYRVGNLGWRLAREASLMVRHLYAVDTLYSLCLLLSKNKIAITKRRLCDLCRFQCWDLEGSWLLLISCCCCYSAA